MKIINFIRNHLIDKIKITQSLFKNKKSKITKLVETISWSPDMNYYDGTMFWDKDGNFHREDGPAVVRSDGYQEWYQNGKVHRTDGPAVTRPDGTQRWCVFGNNKNAYWIYTYHTAWAFT